MNELDMVYAEIDKLKKANKKLSEELNEKTSINKSGILKKIANIRAENE